MVSRQGPARLSPRTLHATAYDETSDILYVHGGFDLNMVLDNLIMYNFTSNQWLSTLDMGQNNEKFNETVDEDPIDEEIDLSENIIEDDIHENKSAKVINKDVKLLKKKIKFTKINSTTVSMQMIPLSDSGNSSTLVRRRRMIPEKVFQTETEYPGEHSNSQLRLKGHKMVLISSGLVVFGGKTAEGRYSNTLWHYNFSSLSWTVRAQLSPVQPTPVWLHCMVLIKDYLYVFGGSTVGGKFVSDMFKINTHTLTEWEVVQVKAGKTPDLRLTGHSCVRHSESLLVFGGISTDMARFSKLSKRLFQFQTVEAVWSEIQYPENSAAPPELAFHSSVIIGNYLIVFGGYVHMHGRYEKCYENSLFFFNLNCFSWQSVEHEHNPPRHDYPRLQGVFGHSAVVRKGTQLIIVGGYQGTVTGDVLGYTVPSTLSSLVTPCHLYGKQTSCTSNPSCVWCGRTGQCFSTGHTESCEGGFLLSSSCPGLCSALTSCISCTAQPGDSCLWCVNTGQCLTAGEENLCPDHSGDHSWWETLQRLTRPEQCSAHDFRPGLTVSQLYQRTPGSFPHSVSIVNSSDMLLSNDNKAGRQHHVSFSVKGTIHPVYDQSKPVRHLETCLTNGKGSLYLSVSPPISPVQRILNISHAKTSCETPKWQDDKLVYLYPHNAFHLKYQLSFLQPEQLRGYQETRVTLQEKETGLIFNSNHLEPYRNGSCSSLVHCKQCIEDSLCGWCAQSQLCQTRAVSECPGHLVTESASCQDCHHHVYCHNCLADPACHWLQPEVSCVRRGLHPPDEVTTDLASCPSLCSDRSSCTECLSMSGRCVWCHSSSSCLLFSVYTSEYQFGGCRHWSDISRVGEEVEEKCDSCSQHSTCSGCLQSLGCGWCNGTCSTRDSCPPPREWQYFTCPDIDECSLGLHNCHPDAVCHNTARAFQCSCSPGYEGDGVKDCSKTCYPACGPHGECEGPPHFSCRCQLGWTGQTCDTDCGCNNLSTCHQGVGVCDDCQANTAGDSCHICKEGFVRDSSGDCVSCGQFCHGHTSSCISRHDLHGCRDCHNGTTGARCDQCLPGTFRTSSDLTLPCEKCFCNGHAENCSPDSGQDCACQNNTFTDLNSQCSADSCWKQQCARCEQYFLGDPRHGHHCYRAMMVNSDYCLDDDLSLPFQPDFCALHTPILPGKVAFFAVQPKFMNVHIRVNVNMMEGEVDVILTSNSQLFLVQNNQSSFLHNVRLDQTQFDHVIYKDFSQQPESLEEVLENYPNIARLLSPKHALRWNHNKDRVFSLRVRQAEGLSTFLSLDSPQEVLLVRNVQNRLIISIPEISHDLRSSKFYLLIYGGLGGNNSEKIVGNLFFRQDQLHIDLFVFFSVFFSCFFLFLSFCVVAWKFKISVDIRSARRRQAAEMTIMARRPFAQQLVMIDRSEDPNTRFCSVQGTRTCPTSPATHRKKGRKLWLGRQTVASEQQAGSVHELLLPQQSADSFSLSAISVETTADNLAAVTSLLIQMPGDQRRLQVGSVLTTAPK